MELEKMINAAQAKVDGALEALLKQFSPLIRKYARKLGYEDALFDVQLDMIDLIYKFNLSKMSQKDDKYLLSYISVSMKNAYSKRLGAIMQIQSSPFSDISEQKLYEIECENARSDDYSVFEFQDMISNLPDKQKIIVQLHYVEEMSINEIALTLGLSRQNVNQIKLRVIAKLHNEII